MGETIAVVSGKGGVGKTVISANIGATLALKGKRVVLLDLDIGLRNLDLALGLVRDKRFPELYLMSSPQLSEKYNVTPSHIKILCKKLKETFDYIIIDAPAGIEEGFVSSVTAADSVVVVTVPEIAAIRDADRVKKMLDNFSEKRKMLIINKVKMDLIHKGVLPNIEYVVDAIKLELVGILPDDENIYVAANNGTPVVLKKGSYLANNFNKISERIML